MKTELIGQTYPESIEGVEDPEDLICVAARNDYLNLWVGDHSYEEIMESVAVDGDLQAKKEFLIKDRLLKSPPHFGPWEHVQFVFAVENASRVCMAQITRHRHASFDIQSFRYTSPDKEEIIRIYEDRDWEAITDYIVVPKAILEVDDDKLYHEFLKDCSEQFYDYICLIETLVEDCGMSRKMAKQDARFLLPKATSVNIVMSCSARSLLHIADMRSAADAQWEIRQMTNELLSLAEEEMPITMEFYEEEMKNRKNRLAP